MSEPPTLSGQVGILRSGVDIATWSLERLGLPASWRDTNVPGNAAHCQEAVDRLFTLRRADLEAELVSLGLVPEQLGHVHLQAGSRDGLYFIIRGNILEIYLQEREGRWAEALFSELDEARKFLLNLWLPVWLKRLRVPCLRRDGKTVIDF